MYLFSRWRQKSIGTRKKKERPGLRAQQLPTVFIFLLPGIFLFLVFNIYPLLKAFQISFYDWSIVPNKPSEYVGLENYVQALKDPIARLAFRNTVLYTIITVPGQIVLAMAAALLLNSNIRGKVLLRTIYYLPVITSWVIVSLLFRYMFQSPNGFINYILVNVFHLVEAPIGWLQSGSTAMIPVWLLGIWKGIGWSMVIFLAALQTIPEEIYEADTIDRMKATALKKRRDDPREPSDADRDLGDIEQLFANFQFVSAA